MTCYPLPAVPSATMCGLPVGLDWLDVPVTDDPSRIACLTCRAWYLIDHPGAHIPLRTPTPRARYTVKTSRTDTHGLSWEDALDLYRLELKLQEADYAARIGELVSCFLTEGTRVIAGVCYSVEYGPAIDTRLPEGEKYPYLSPAYGR